MKSIEIIVIIPEMNPDPDKISVKMTVQAHKTVDPEKGKLITGVALELALRSLCGCGNCAPNDSPALPTMPFPKNVM